MPEQHQIFEIFSDENGSGVAFKNKTLKRSLINFLDKAVGLGMVRELEGVGFDTVEVRISLDPAWTTDWISDDGRRKLVSLSELTGMEGDVIVTQDLFKFEYRDEDSDGKIHGE